MHTNAFNVWKLQETAMKFAFEVDGTSIEFSRNWFTGQCTLTVGTESRTLASQLNPFTHYSLTLERRWAVPVNGREVVIEKQRPLLFAGLRPHTYRVFVDGNLVQERTGY